MSKKLVVLIILILLIIIGGVFWWWQGKEKIKPSLEPLEYIIVRETPEGKFVENKKEGLIVKVPEGWEVQLPTGKEGSTTIFSPDIVEDEIIWDIVFSIFYKTTDVPMLKKERAFELSDLHGEQFLQFVSFETIKVAECDALKTIIDTTTPEGEGEYIISVDVPADDKLYSFTTHAGFQDKEKAIQEFDRFLRTISIE